MVVFGDEVIVCECNNIGTITVYNREIQYIRRIEHDNMGLFKDMSIDCYDNLYVYR